MNSLSSQQAAGKCPRIELYGNKLYDFIIVTVTNQNDVPEKVVVESEITDYTNKSIDTVDVQTGEILEIRQNPRLNPDVIDELNVEKLAQVHIRVIALKEGVEKPILDETNETVVFARRDFPWSISGFEADEVFELVSAIGYDK